MSLFLRREILAWSLYDFANSAFATTVLAVVFNVYFVQVICAGGVPLFGRLVPGAAFWGYVVSASMLAVLLISPPAGAAADASARKKKFLLCFTLLGCVCTAGLFFCREGDVWLASGLFVCANAGFSMAGVFYNALLQDVSSRENVGRVSGFGWALGYLGGGLLLAVNLGMIERPRWFGLAPQDHLPVRASILSVSAWWAVFSLPLFLWVKEKGAPQALTECLPARAFRDVFQTLREIRRHREIFKYLLANLVYNDGIETVILMASIFGAQALGLAQGELILCFLMIQAVAFFGALLFGHLADRVAHNRVIAITLWAYVAVCLWGAFIRSKAEFWILGVAVGLILGGSQAASRSFLSLLVPPEKSGQFFGFFALTQKFATVIGPLVFGLLIQLVSLRAAVAGLAVFFVAGLILLQQVQEPVRCSHLV